MMKLVFEFILALFAILLVPYATVIMQYGIKHHDVYKSAAISIVGVAVFVLVFIVLRRGL